MIQENLHCSYLFVIFYFFITFSFDNHSVHTLVQTYLTCMISLQPLIRLNEMDFSVLNFSYCEENILFINIEIKSSIPQ